MIKKLLLAAVAVLSVLAIPACGGKHHHRGAGTPPPTVVIGGVPTPLPIITPFGLEIDEVLDPKGTLADGTANWAQIIADLDARAQAWLNEELAEGHTQQEVMNLLLGTKFTLVVDKNFNRTDCKHGHNAHWDTVEGRAYLATDFMGSGQPKLYCGGFRDSMEALEDSKN